MKDYHAVIMKDYITISLLRTDNSVGETFDVEVSTQHVTLDDLKQVLRMIVNNRFDAFKNNNSVNGVGGDLYINGELVDSLTIFGPFAIE